MNGTVMFLNNVIEHVMNLPQPSQSFAPSFYPPVLGDLTVAPT